MRLAFRFRKFVKHNFSQYGIIGLVLGDGLCAGEQMPESLPASIHSMMW
jgi:hypothetical protein